MSVIERGSCSACHQPARRGPSGNWWHLPDPCTAPRRWHLPDPCTAPEDIPAEFIPDEADTP